VKKPARSLLSCPPHSPWAFSCGAAKRVLSRWMHLSHKMAGTYGKEKSHPVAGKIVASVSE
jgi:hypothetical protein